MKTKHSLEKKKKNFSIILHILLNFISFLILLAIIFLQDHNSLYFLLDPKNRLFFYLIKNNFKNPLIIFLNKIKEII